MDAFTVFLPVAGVDFNWLILLLIGFSVGVMGGFFGIGGGPVLTPALNIFGFPMSVAIGTGMLNVFGQSIVGARRHTKLGNVDLRLGLTVGGSMLFGVEAGKQAVLFLEALNLAETVIRLMYMGLLVGLAAHILRDYLAVRRRGAHLTEEGNATHKHARPKHKLGVSIGLGLGIGSLAGFLGVGGGFLIVPAFIYLLGLPTNMAVGTSVFCCVMSGAYGGFSYAAQGRVDVVAALFMLAGAAFGAAFGAAAVKYAHGYGIRLLYVLMLLMAGCGVLLKQLDEMIPTVDLSLAAQIVILSAAGVLCLNILGKLVRGLLADRRLHPSA